MLRRIGSVVFAALALGWLPPARAGDVRLVVEESESRRVASAAVSPDGTRIVTGGRDGVVRLREAATGQEIRTFRGPPEVARSVAVSADGRRVVAGMRDATVRVWDVATGREVLRLDGHERMVEIGPFGERGEVLSVAFSPDGRWILTGANDKTVRLWSAADGHEIRRFEGHGGRVTNVAFMADGLRALSTGQKGTTRLWNLETGRESTRLVIRRSMSDLGLYVESVAVSPDGRWILTGEADGVARLWEAETGREWLSVVGPAEPVRVVAFLGDGERFLTGCEDGSVRIWRLADGEEVGRWSGPRPVAVDPTAERVLAAREDGAVDVLTATSGELVVRMRGGGVRVRAMALAPHDRRLAVALGDDTVRLRDLGLEGGPVATPDGLGAATALDYSPDGGLLATGDARGLLRIHDAGTGEAKAMTNAHGGEIHGVAFCADGSRLVTQGEDGRARVWEREEGLRRLSREFRVDLAANVAIAPEGDAVLIGRGRHGRVLRDNGVRLSVFDGHFDSVTHVAFGPDGSFAVTASADGTARVWDASTGEEIRRLEARGRAMQRLAITADGKRVITAEERGILRVWDVESGRETRRHEGGPESFEHLLVSRDGRVVLGSDGGPSIHVWTADSTKPIVRLVHLREDCWAVIHPSGRYDTATADAPDGVHWVVGEEAVTFDRLDSRYRVPGLLGLALAGRPLPDVPDSATWRPPPVVEATVVAGTPPGLDLVVRDRGGGIGTVRVRVDGAPVNVPAGRPASAGVMRFRVVLPAGARRIEADAGELRDLIRSRTVRATVGPR